MNVPPSGPNQVWQLDFTEFETRHGGVWRIAGVSDYWSKLELGWHVSTTQEPSGRDRDARAAHLRRARTTTDKMIIAPIAAFVAVGFEHSVANMYFIPIGLFIKTDDSFVAGLDNAPDLSHLTWGSFLGDNLLPVTLGNIVGGGLMVGLVYWFVYLRGSRAQA